MKNNLWQHPYVNILKEFGETSWKKSVKEGEISTYMDKILKSTVYQLKGSIPAANCITIPSSPSSSLGLTGRYIYFLFKPLPNKHFVLHVDAATPENLGIRVSVSTLYRELRGADKSSSTVLQVPYLCQMGRGSLHEDAVTAPLRDLTGPAQDLTRWTVLRMDMVHILGHYLDRSYGHVRSITMCANIALRGVITSDLAFEPPGSRLTQGAGESATHRLFPREVAFFLCKGDSWHDQYDFISFPIEMKSTSGGKRTTSSVSHSISSHQHEVKPEPSSVTELPQILPNSANHTITSVPVEVLGHALHTLDSREKENNQPVHSSSAVSLKKADTPLTVQADSLMSLRRVIGYGCASVLRDVLLSDCGTEVVYPCHALVVAMAVVHGHQRFFVGHTGQVSCLALVGSLLASGQSGPDAVVKLWQLHTQRCIGTARTHDHALTQVALSADGQRLAAVGKNAAGRTLLAVWDCGKLGKAVGLRLVAKGTADVDITRIRFLHLTTDDHYRLASCGRGNLRFWRIRESKLRCAPVALGDFGGASLDFTDLAVPIVASDGRAVVLVCARSGHILEVDCTELQVIRARRLLPTEEAIVTQRLPGGSGIPLTALAVHQAFVLTGSADGFLRLWARDLSGAYLEAEHDSSVLAVGFSLDGLSVVIGTAGGSLGTLDVTSRRYTTLMRSHAQEVTSAALDPVNEKRLITCSRDGTLRVWDTHSLQQLFDYTAPNDDWPLTVAYHPSNAPLFAAGFHSGAVRIFDMSSASMVAELMQNHSTSVTGLLFCCPTFGQTSFLYSSDVTGVLAMSEQEGCVWRLNRLVNGALVKSATNQFGFNCLVADPMEHRIAFIGPTEHIVTIMDGLTLREIVKVDVASSVYSRKRPTTLDSAVRLAYTPADACHLLVATSSRRLLKLDRRDGRFLGEMLSLHQSAITALAVSPDCRHLATAGERVLKIWDYHMHQTVEHQVFIGHGGPIHRLLFKSNGEHLISVGEAIFVWKFYGGKKLAASPRLEGRVPIENFLTGKMNAVAESRGPLDEASDEMLVESDDIASRVGPVVTVAVENVTANSEETVQSLNKVSEVLPNNPRQHILAKEKIKFDGVPTAVSHFKARALKLDVTNESKNVCRYLASNSQEAGMRLNGTLTYNGNGRNNVVWSSLSGNLIYSSGGSLVTEELVSGHQRVLRAHLEEVSSLIISYNEKMLASASRGQIRIWCLTSTGCEQKAVLVDDTIMEHDIVSLAFSRDDSYIAALTDHRQAALLVWSAMDNWRLMCCAKLSLPHHHLCWSPAQLGPRLLLSVGCGNVVFWNLEAGKALRAQEGCLPTEEAILRKGATIAVEFTTATFASEEASIAFVGDTLGEVSCWLGESSAWLAAWPAHRQEVTALRCGGAPLTERLVSSCTAGFLRLWDIAPLLNFARAIGEDFTNGRIASSRPLTPLLAELRMDGPITALALDSALQLGVIGCASGAIHYVNWKEQSVPLVSGPAASAAISALTAWHDLVAATDTAGILRVWQLPERQLLARIQVSAPAQCTAEALCFSMSGSHVVAGYVDGVLRVVKLHPHVRVEHRFQPHAVACTALIFLSDSCLISSAEDGLLVMSDCKSGLVRQLLRQHCGVAVRSLASTSMVDNCGSWAAAANDGRISIWSHDNGIVHLVHWLNLPHNLTCPPLVAFSSTELLLYSCCTLEGPQLVLYNIRSRISLSHCSLPREPSVLMVATDNNDLVAMGSQSDTVLSLVDTEAGTFQDFLGHNDFVSHCAFAGADRLVSASGGDLFVWRLQL